MTITANAELTVSSDVVALKPTCGWEMTIAANTEQPLITTAPTTPASNSCRERTTTTNAKQTPFGRRARKFPVLACILLIPTSRLKMLGRSARAFPFVASLFRLCLFAFTATFLFPSFVHAAHLETSCLRLYKKKRWSQAAQCFQRIAATLQTRGESKKYYRGRMLRNAVLVLQKAAVKASTADANKHRNTAIQLLNIYISEKLCSIPERCKSASKRREQIRSKLTRMTPPPSRRILPPPKRSPTPPKKNDLPPLPGERKTPPPADPLSLLPKERTSPTPPRAKNPDLGSFRMSSTPPLRPNPPPSSRRPLPRVALHRNSSTKTPPTTRPLPLLSWIGYIGGGLCIVAGGALIGTGFTQRSELIARWRNPQVQVTLEERDNILQSTETLAWSGVGVLGLGAALLAGALVFQMRRPTSTPPPNDDEPSRSSKHRSRFSSRSLTLFRGQP